MNYKDNFDISGQFKYSEKIESKNDHKMYDYISCVIVQSLYFGAYPVQDMIYDLIKNDFNVVVNLTQQDDILYKYSISHGIEQINFPIKDGDEPENDIEYCKFILQICEKIQLGQKIYIHCRAGHTRSSLVCISVLCVLYDYDLKTSISKVLESHQKRNIINPKWKKLYLPINYKQNQFLIKIHKNIYLSNIGYYKWIFSEEDYENTENMISKNIHKYFLNKYKNNKFLENNIKYTFLRKFIFPSIQSYRKYACILNEVRQQIINN